MSVDEFDRDRTGHCRHHNTRRLLSTNSTTGGRWLAFSALQQVLHDSADVERSQGLSRARVANCAGPKSRRPGSGSSTSHGYRERSSLAVSG
jgi:hypothetical protein